MNALQKLRQLTNDLAKAGAAAKADDWALAGRLLARTPVDQAAVTAAVSARDAAALDRIVAALERPAPAAATPDAAEVTEREMNDAMRAFRKRIKLLRLNDESKLGAKQLTGGKRSEIDAIEPPREFPPRVWRALVRAGRLRDAGEGFMQLGFGEKLDA